jgi:hypothetical protein
VKGKVAGVFADYGRNLGSGSYEGFSGDELRSGLDRLVGWVEMWARH